MIKKISKKIIEEINRKSKIDPAKGTYPYSVAQICEAIVKKQLVIPQFQIFIRWPEKKMVDLYNYMLESKSPLSSISINKMRFSKNIGKHYSILERKLIPNEDMKNAEGIVDGFQRCLSLANAYTNKEEVSRIVFDMKKGKFILINDISKIKIHQIPVGILYNEHYEVYEDYLKNNPFLDEYKYTLDNIRNKFFHYNITINMAEDLDEEAQIIWFNELNLGGVRLTAPMVLLSGLLDKGADFYYEYSKPFIEIFKQKNLMYLFARKSTETSIPLAVLNCAYEYVFNLEHKNNFCPIASDAKISKISKCSVEDIKLMFTLVLNSLEKTFDLLKDNLDDIDRIEVYTFITGYFVKNNRMELSKERKEMLLNWAIHVDFERLGNSERRELFTNLLNNNI